MGVGTLLIIVVLGALLLTGVGMVVAHRSTLTGSQRKELLELRKFKHKVNQLAVSHQEIEPNLAACIMDEVHSYEMKELS